MRTSIPPFIHRNPHGDRLRIDALAVEILTFLGADRARLEHFCAATGLTVATLRQAAAEPDFSASLLDYLASDERLLLAFAQESGHAPGEIEALRQSVAPPAPGDG